LIIVSQKTSSADKFYPILLYPFFTLNVFFGQSNHLNDVRIDYDWKVRILFGTEIGWLMCYDLGFFLSTSVRVFWLTSVDDDFW